MSNERISSTETSDYDQSPDLVYDNATIKIEFRRDHLKQDKVTYNHGPIVNIYINNISINNRLIPGINDSGVTLKNCLFGSVKLTKNTDIDKYKYSGYGIGLDSRASFTYLSDGYGKNVIIWGADMSSSAHANNKTRSILVNNNTTTYAEKMYSTNFTEANKKIFLSLDYNGDDSYLFVNGKEIINFKAKESEIALYPLCLGGLSKDFSPTNAAKIGLDGHVCDFSVDYWAIAIDKILDIQKYLMKKNNIV